MVKPISQYRDRNIEFSRSQPCVVEVNGPEIKQVVLNLAANALEAMDSGGTLKIEITEQVDEVILTFDDDGCGMTPEVIEHLFEPFFTRRREGKGTGLGMSISHRIISDHGGTIEATSDGSHCGSCFRIHLPRRVSVSNAAA
jgi:signal transduction histidine kinase